MMDTVTDKYSEIGQIGILMLKSLPAVNFGKILPKFYQNCVFFQTVLFVYYFFSIAQNFV